MTAVIRTFIAALSLTAPLFAQPEPTALPAAPTTPALDLTPPGPAESLDAFKAVEGWLHDWAVPDALHLRGLENAGACSITLRLDGRVVGRGVSFTPGPDGLAHATRAALDEALTRLPIPQDALAAESARALAPRLTISLEVAGPLIPFTPETFTEVDATLEPGLDGIAARFGTGISGAFPGAMLAMNIAPSDALVAAISQASGDPTLSVKGDPKGQPASLAESHNARYYKFRVTHLAQPAEGQAPAFLFRGGRVVEPLSITRASIDAFAEELLTHLERRIVRDGDSPHLIATRFPFQDRVEADATPLETLVTVHAMARALERRPRPRLVPLLFSLRDSVTESALASPIDAAAWIMASDALDALPRPEDAPDANPTLRARIGARVAGAFDPETGWTEDVPPPARAFVAYALAIEARAAGLEAEEAHARAARARAALTTVYQDTTPGKLVAHMPWLGLAEMLLSGDEIASAPALLVMREEVWKHKLPDDITPPDLAGGIVFTASANPLPTWQSVRPVLFLAAAARDPRLTTQSELLPEVSHLLGAVRFLRQLAVDEYAAHAAADPHLAQGGIRNSLWDQRQPIEASALTLMTLCELLDTLDAASKQRP